MRTTFHTSKCSAAALLCVGLLAGCVTAPAAVRLGDPAAPTASFALPPAARSAERATVKLEAPAYVAMLFVVPGRGSVVVYPGDSAASNYVPAGEHDVSVHWTQRPMNRDSLFAAARREAARGTGSGGSPRVSRRDSVANEATRGKGPIAEPNPASSPVGYLLLVASPSNLSLSRIKRRVEGITIPIEDGEALQTVMQLVKGTLPQGAALTGYAKELER